MITQRWLEAEAGRLALVVVVGAAVACGTPAPVGQGDRTPAGLAAAKSSGPGEPDKVNMDEIFPAGAGRDLVLNNCQNCHTFVPIVVLQMDDEAWTRNSRDHRMRVSGLSDDEFNTAYAYVKKHFNQNHPVPKLPQVLLDSWTTA